MLLGDCQRSRPRARLPTPSAPRPTGTSTATLTELECVCTAKRTVAFSAIWPRASAPATASTELSPKRASAESSPAPRGAAGGTIEPTKGEPMPQRTDEEARQIAVDTYACDDVEIDLRAAVSRPVEENGEGCWVPAWVWVSFEGD